MNNLNYKKILDSVLDLNRLIRYYDLNGWVSYLEKDYVVYVIEGEYGDEFFHPLIEARQSFEKEGYKCEIDGSFDNCGYLKVWPK